MSTNLINDGGFEIAKPHGPVRLSAPFDGVTTDYVLEQDWVQFNSVFAPLPLSTPHPDYSAYLLVKESPLQPVGVLDAVKWVRTYAQVPATRSEPTTAPYRFIGFTGYVSAIGGTITNNVPGRKPFTQSVNCRIQYDYFLSTTPSTIPVMRAQAYYFRIGTITGSGPYTWTATYTLGSAQDIAQGSPTDYILDTTGTYAVSNSIVPCVPSRTAYMALIAAGTEIAIEDSQLSRWMGNIFVRSTKYTVAR